MEKLRVLIVSDGTVVDVQEFEDPRIRFVEDFNQLNQATPFVAMLQRSTEPVIEVSRTGPRCHAQRHCRIEP